MRLKDKNRPKSPLSGFACFVQVIRDKHRSLHPNENVIFNEFAKRCAERWREMPPDKRAPFEEMSRLDTKRYNREMGEYVQQQQLQQQQQLPPQPMMHPQQQQQPQSGGQLSTFEHHHHMRGAKRRRLKDPSMPKRALSAFFFFCDHYRSEVRNSHPEWRVSEVAKELGRLWDECSDKAPYELQAQKDKLRYEEEMRRYKEGTFVMAPKRLRDISAMSGGGVDGGAGDGGRGDSSANVNVANCFEIEGSREVDEMDGKGGDDDIDEEDVDDYEEDEEEEDEDADEGADEGTGYEEEVEKEAVENMDEGDDAAHLNEQNEDVEAESGEDVETTPTPSHHHNQRQAPNAFSVAYVVSGGASKGKSGVVDEDVGTEGAHNPTADEDDDD
ncbi:High mobility group protein DSP1 [Taenia crassiceps]|uniref:High mobility group protein DSP1 n=1 Tax=Taenia crassiceps TaxID=6207 RepID=A0ABR4QTK2_9CEST